MGKISIWKTLAVIMVLLSLATGMCFAKDAENLTKIWEEEIETDRPGEKAKYYIDEAKTQVIDYSGRKYLQLYVQKNKVFMEQFWFVLTWREDEKAHWTIIYDVAQHKAFISEFMNKDSKQKEGHNDISLMLQNSSNYSNFDKKIMDWMLNNRRSVLENVVLENGDEPESIDYNYVPFKEQLQQKREQLKDALKKLNDAVYVHNNASDFPKKTVYEADNLINTVVGKIRDKESGKLYQELVPQEVRSAFESGVYKQQYEQLKAEVEAEERAIYSSQNPSGTGYSIYRPEEGFCSNCDISLTKNIYAYVLPQLKLIGYDTPKDSIQETLYTAGYLENRNDVPVYIHTCTNVYNKATVTNSELAEWPNIPILTLGEKPGYVYTDPYIAVDLQDEMVMAPHSKCPIYVYIYSENIHQPGTADKHLNKNTVVIIRPLDVSSDKDVYHNAFKLSGQPVADASVLQQIEEEFSKVGPEGKPELGVVEEETVQGFDYGFPPGY